MGQHQHSPLTEQSRALAVYGTGARRLFPSPIRYKRSKSNEETIPSGKPDKAIGSTESLTRTTAVAAATGDTAAAVEDRDGTTPTGPRVSPPAKSATDAPLSPNREDERVQQYQSPKKTGLQLQTNPTLSPFRAYNGGQSGKASIGVSPLKPTAVPPSTEPSPKGAGPSLPTADMAIESPVKRSSNTTNSNSENETMESNQPKDKSAEEELSRNTPPSTMVKTTNGTAPTTTTAAGAIGPSTKKTKDRETPAETGASNRNQRVISPSSSVEGHQPRGNRIWSKSGDGGAALPTEVHAPNGSVESPSQRSPLVRYPRGYYPDSRFGIPQPSGYPSGGGVPSHSSAPLPPSAYHPGPPYYPPSPHNPYHPMYSAGNYPGHPHHETPGQTASPLSSSWRLGGAPPPTGPYGHHHAPPAHSIYGHSQQPPYAGSSGGVGGYPGSPYGAPSMYHHPHPGAVSRFGPGSSVSLSTPTLHHPKPASPSSSMLGKRTVQEMEAAGTMPTESPGGSSSHSGAGSTEDPAPKKIKSVAEWQRAARSTGLAPSANRCVALKAPIPSRFWG